MPCRPTDITSNGAGEGNTACPFKTAVTTKVPVWPGNNFDGLELT